MTLTRDMLADHEWREQIAMQAYYRERLEEVAKQKEHDITDEHDYFVISWEDVSDFGKQPYRTAVAEALDRVADLVVA